MDIENNGLIGVEYCHGLPILTKKLYPRPHWMIICKKCGRTVAGEDLRMVSALWNAEIWGERK